MRVALRLPALMLGLAVLWVALWDRITVGNVLAGLLVAAVVVLAAPRQQSPRQGVHFHPWHTLRYGLRLGVSLIESNLRLAWEILTPGNGTHTGIIAVPMLGASDDVVTLVANSITLTPGTLTVEARRDGDTVTLYIHGMFTRDVEAVRRDVLALEARALRAFGTAGEAAHAERGLRRHDDRMQARRDEERS